MIGLPKMARRTITRRGAQLLAALRSAEGWMTRAELASATGKNWMTPNDMIQLERMAAAGLIEISQQVPIRGPRARWVYRAKGESPCT
jgi:hypothetical protein